ncbi:MAG: glycoside hydrolase family 5 protein [Candidatus Hydrogenedentes bacterium]|nr:glycoside hydrolase family 5 protein [Candidatus Hydrogenedentota bacterium]
MYRDHVYRILAAFIPIVAATTVAFDSAALEEPAEEWLPRWRGFNLVDMFSIDRPESGRFQEEDFRLIAALGFNFVRLPMDYRFWIVDGDWERINENAFGPLDEVLNYGERYNIHICMNFHRAPGHTVAQPAEPQSLWEDPEALRVCALHWRYFARRYKGIPNERLSFNLLNEPHDIDGELYASIVKLLADAIREEDPDRLIIADGLDWGTKPCEALIPLRVAQSTRGYQPFNLTHYRATWASGSDQWPTPEWPARKGCGGFLYGPWKPELAAPLVLEVALAHPAELTLTVGDVSSRARLCVVSAGKTLHDELFTTGPGEGPWKTSRRRPEYNDYQCTYDKNIVLQLPPGTYTVEASVTEGDWLSLTRAVITFGDGQRDEVPWIPKWGDPIGRLVFKEREGRFQSACDEDADWLWETTYKDWATLREKNVGVMAGEWGSFNKTPHEATLRWMEDVLRSFQRAGIGWALWNFRGSFGVLDSGRADVAYEAYEGHQLDRKMLELLQRY